MVKQCATARFEQSTLSICHTKKTYLLFIAEGISLRVLNNMFPTVPDAFARVLLNIIFNLIVNHL